MLLYKVELCLTYIKYKHKNYTYTKIKVKHFLNEKKFIYTKTVNFLGIVLSVCIKLCI